MRYLAALVLVGCGTTPLTLELTAGGVSTGSGNLELLASVMDLDRDADIAYPHHLQATERVVAAVDGTTYELATAAQLPVSDRWANFAAAPPITASAAGDLVVVEDTTDMTLKVDFTMPDDFELQPVPTTIHESDTMLISWSPQKKDLMRWSVTGDCAYGPGAEAMLDTGNLMLSGLDLAQLDCPVTLVVERYRDGAGGSQGIQRRTATITVVADF
jgi:hypothetical protein